MNTLISSNNTLNEEKTYQYEITSTTVKIGNNNTNQKIVVFYTIGDNDLRYIEDICEELCHKHSLPFTSTKFYEYETINEKWNHIDIKWDNKRFRGTCFLDLDYNPLEGKPKIQKVKKIEILEDQKQIEAKEQVFTTYQQLLQAK